MRIFAALLVVLMTTLPCAQQVSAQTTSTSHYLNLGADPQDPGRQLLPGEVAILTDSDTCDSGWGSGSGRRITGCYQKNTLVFARATDHILTAVGRCGNTPNDQHVVTGKIIEIAGVPNAPTPQVQVPQQTTGSSSSSSSIVVVVDEGRQQPTYYPSQPKYKVARTCGTGCKVLIGVGIVGGVVAIVFATHHTSAAGVPPTGSTGLTF